MNDILNKVLHYKDEEKNLPLALKYAYIGASMGYSPRADICCLIADIYLEMGNLDWSKKWYENALNNLSVGFDEELVEADYFTIIPMLKLGYISHMIGDDSSAMEYFNGVLKINPDNEIAKDNIRAISKENGE